MEKIVGFPPIHGKDAKLLLLGSMPSVASLEHHAYYAHPQNHFWKLLFCVLDETYPAEYAERVKRLQARGVAVWDSIHACTRAGSLDKDIKNVEPNDVPGFLAANPTICAVAFNGTLSQRVYDTHFLRMPGIRYVLLPSSSPVPRRQIRRLEDKLPAWLALRSYLENE